MAGQQQRRDVPRDGEPEAAAPAPAKQVTERDDAVDALLSEIDDVLETNAEGFVRGFVQKGGQ